MQDAMLWRFIARHRELRDDRLILAWKLCDMTVCSDLLQVCGNEHAMPATSDIDFVQLGWETGVWCSNVHKPRENQ